MMSRGIGSYRRPYWHFHPCWPASRPSKHWACLRWRSAKPVHRAVLRRWSQWHPFRLRRTPELWASAGHLCWALAAGVSSQFHFLPSNPQHRPGYTTKTHPTHYWTDRQCKPLKLSPDPEHSTIPRARGLVGRVGLKIQRLILWMYAWYKIKIHNSHSSNLVHPYHHRWGPSHFLHSVRSSHFGQQSPLGCFRFLLLCLVGCDSRICCARTCEHFYTINILPISSFNPITHSPM